MSALVLVGDNRVVVLGGGPWGLERKDSIGQVDEWAVIALSAGRYGE